VSEPGLRLKTPLWAYLLASALLWAVFLPVAEWATGDLDGVARTALEGAGTGLVWGALMFVFERWLERRRVT
jgi:hypothetical protein